MNKITHVMPAESGLETKIHAEANDKYLIYSYSHAYDMLHDAKRPGSWIPGIADINSAIIYVMNVS